MYLCTVILLTRQLYYYGCIYLLNTLSLYCCDSTEVFGKMAELADALRLHIGVSFRQDYPSDRHFAGSSPALSATR